MDKCIWRRGGAGRGFTRFIFRGPQGDQIIFPKDSDFYNYAGTINLASSWQMANGELLTLTYEVALKAFGGWNPVRRLSQVVNSRGYGLKFNYLLPGNGQPNVNYTNTDWRRMTVASVDAIAPGCVAGTATPTCDASKLGHVYYNYSDQAGSTSFSMLRMDSVQDPDGNVTAFQWSGRLLASESNPAVPGAYRFQNSWVNNAITQQIDPMNNVWLYRRTTDASGYVVAAEVEDPLHAVTRYSYVAGKTAPEWIEDPAGPGRRTKFVYDAKGRT